MTARFWLPDSYGNGALANVVFYRHCVALKRRASLVCGGSKRQQRASGEPVAELAECVVSGSGRCLGVDLHRDGDLAVPQMRMAMRGWTSRAASSETQALQARSVDRAVTIAGEVVSHVVVALRLLAVTGRRAPRATVRRSG